MSIIDIKRKARSALHERLKRAAYYYPNGDPADVPVLVHVRVHYAPTLMGRLPGRMHWAQAEEMAPKIIFLRDEFDDVKPGAMVVLSADEGYALDATQPPDDITRIADASRSSQRDLAGFNPPPAGS